MKVSLHHCDINLPRFQIHAHNYIIIAILDNGSANRCSIMPFQHNIAAKNCAKIKTGNSLIHNLKTLGLVMFYMGIKFNTRVWSMQIDGCGLTRFQSTLHVVNRLIIRSRHFAGARAALLARKPFRLRKSSSVRCSSTVCRVAMESKPFRKCHEQLAVWVTSILVCVRVPYLLVSHGVYVCVCVCECVCVCVCVCVWCVCACYVFIYVHFVWRFCYCLFQKHFFTYQYIFVVLHVIQYLLHFIRFSGEYIGL